MLKRASVDGVPGDGHAGPIPRPRGDPALVEDAEPASEALRQGEWRSPPELAHLRRRWLPFARLLAYAAVVAALAWAYPLIGSGYFHLAPDYATPLKRLAEVLLLAAVVRAAATVAEVLLLVRLGDPVARYNLIKVVHLVSWVLILLVGYSQLFSQWYAAVASLGVGSLIVGLALQSTLTSFFGWVYILLRQPYRVGDRIKIGDVTGDVIQVGYLDTTLWEFGGPYLSTDHPSGRIVKFPNSTVLSSPVYNYTWPLFPYIWNEIKFQVAYNADLELIARTMQAVVEDDLGEEMLRRVETYRKLLAETPVDELEVQERPQVLFRVNDNTWIEAIVRYVVDPRQAGRVKTRLIKKLLTRLNSDGDRVLFPSGNAR